MNSNVDSRADRIAPSPSASRGDHELRHRHRIDHCLSCGVNTREWRVTRWPTTHPAGSSTPRASPARPLVAALVPVVVERQCGIEGRNIRLAGRGTMSPAPPNSGPGSGRCTAVTGPSNWATSSMGRRTVPVGSGPSGYPPLLRPNFGAVNSFSLGAAQLRRRGAALHGFRGCRRDPLGTEFGDTAGDRRRRAGEVG